jgi:mono/diheme cytochrome c family protein
VKDLRGRAAPGGVCFDSLIASGSGEERMKPFAVAAAGCAAAGLAVFAVGAASDGASYDPALAERGSELFVRYCASCHGENGKGGGTAAGELESVPADLTRIAARRRGVFPDAEIARFIDGRFEVSAHGTREMPVWGERLGQRIPEAGPSEEIVRGRILVLVEYLKSIQMWD